VKEYKSITIAVMVLSIFVVIGGISGCGSSVEDASYVQVFAEVQQKPVDTQEQAELPQVIDDVEEPEQDEVQLELFEGLHFDIHDVFVVENITEITQYHLNENQRNDPLVLHMYEYHMGNPVLFIPLTITTVEVQEGDSEYRFRPGIRTRTPSGTLSVFEADTLNSRRIFQGPFGTFDEIPNYEGAVVEGYLSFGWEGYGDYRVEILAGRDMLAEFVFYVNEDNAIISELGLEYTETAEDAYRAFIIEITDQLAANMNEFSNQNIQAGANPALILDDTWVVRTLVIVTQIRFRATEILDYDVNTVPLEYREAHAQLVLAARTFCQAMSYYTIGLDYADVASLNRASELITRATDYIRIASNLM